MTFNDFRKLQYLVPDADCSTRGGEIIEWRDARPQPTYDEINAVEDSVVDQIQEDEKTARLDYGEKAMILLRVCHRQQNEIRELQGKSEITFKRFVDAVRTLEEA